jgi:antitoxin component HigA of HigAB toxin-antitoxin module
MASHGCPAGNLTAEHLKKLSSRFAVSADQFLV